jgi:hypothetical protein
MERAHKENPQYFPANSKDWNIIGDHVGIYHVLKKENEHVRVEKEIIGNQKVKSISDRVRSNRGLVML